jgi:hypothetical protein
VGSGELGIGNWEYSSLPFPKFYVEKKLETGIIYQHCPNFLAKYSHILLLLAGKFKKLA